MSLDDELRAALAAKEPQRAATLVVRAYGPEIYGFLRAMARDDDLAAEAFAQLGEDLWRGLPSFRFDAPVRAWAYALARHALHRLRRDPRRRAGHNRALSEAPEIAAELRTATAIYQRTEVKDAVRALRDELDPEDHELLMLRLDRQLSWKDIARVLDGDGDLTARAAALRKRFERAKTRLRELLRARGLLPEN